MSGDDKVVSLRQGPAGPTLDVPQAVAEITAEGLGFTDMSAAFNMRDWLQSACEAKGAKMTGGGFGFGQADIDIDLEGCAFNISIKPIVRD